MGAYPPGSVVVLSDDSVAIVIEAPRGKDVFRPVVKRVGETEQVDLTESLDLSVTEVPDPDEASVPDAAIESAIKPAA